MNSVYLLIGGNLGNREKNLERTIELLNIHTGEIVQKSAVYETAPWGFTAKESFLNQALLLHTSLKPLELLAHTNKVEDLMGRQRGKERYSSRLMDIDILFFNDLSLSSEALEIPHPRIQERRFALIPMAEIAPDFIHPIFGKSIKELLLICRDTLEVKKSKDGLNGA